MLLPPTVVAVAAPIVADLVFTDSNPDEGDDTAAVCEWIGSPIPEVTWFKNGEPLDEETLPSRIRIILTNDFRSELQIREVELDDTGDYVCNVSSPVGFDFRVATLEVIGIIIHTFLYIHVHAKTQYTILHRSK